MIFIFNSRKALCGESYSTLMLIVAGDDFPSTALLSEDEIYSRLLHLSADDYVLRTIYL